MTGSGPYPDTGDDTAVGRGRGSIPGTPRWVKVSGIIALVVVLLIDCQGRSKGGPVLPVEKWSTLVAAARRVASRRRVERAGRAR